MVVTQAGGQGDGVQVPDAFRVHAVFGFLFFVVGGRSVGVPGIPKLLEDVHKRTLNTIGLLTYNEQTDTIKFNCRWAIDFEMHEKDITVVLPEGLD